MRLTEESPAVKACAFFILLVLGLRAERCGTHPAKKFRVAELQHLDQKKRIALQYLCQLDSFNGTQAGEARSEGVVKLHGVRRTELGPYSAELHAAL